MLLKAGVIWKMKIIAALKYHFNPARMLVNKVKKHKYTITIFEDVQSGKPCAL